jgi:hypothetical protein
MGVYWFAPQSNCRRIRRGFVFIVTVADMCWKEKAGRGKKKLGRKTKAQARERRQHKVSAGQLSLFHAYSWSFYF